MRRSFIFSVESAHRPSFDPLELPYTFGENVLVTDIWDESEIRTILAASVFW